ncbi:MAG: hypothetical protein TV41_06320 [Wolbachia endosymbiont of Dactylopius coccus]|nr:MAG: hypothetical protein TV41_06320 [Wolbachia endosymbiont of Dactylopius coccus]
MSTEPSEIRDKIFEGAENAQLYDFISKVMDSKKIDQNAFESVKTKIENMDLSLLPQELKTVVEEMKGKENIEEVRDVVASRRVMLEKATGWAMHAQMFGSIVGNAVDGNIEDAAKNLAILGGDMAIGRAFGVTPISWYFMLSSLLDDFDRLNAGDHSTFLKVKTGLDATVLALSLLAISNPELAPIVEVVILGEMIWLAIERVKQEDELLHMTETEKLAEGMRAFFFMKPEKYIAELIGEKEANNELVKQALKFLKRHNDIQRYVFPTGKLVDVNIDYELEQILKRTTIGVFTSSYPSYPNGSISYKDFTSSPNAEKYYLDHNGKPHGKDGKRYSLFFDSCKDAEKYFRLKKCKAYQASLNEFEKNPYMGAIHEPANRRARFYARNVCNKTIVHDQNSNVYLDKKEFNITLHRSRPDNPSEGELICLPSGNLYPADESEHPYFVLQLPHPSFNLFNITYNLPDPLLYETYRCDNAIGVSYSKNRTGNYTLIALGDGIDQAFGFKDTPNIFHVGNGNKNFTGGDDNDLFILEGNNTKAFLDGGAGNNVLDFGRFSLGTNLSIYGDRMYSLPHQGYVLDMQNVSIILGRKDEAEVISSSCITKYIDGRGGKNSTNTDHIILNAERFCHCPNLQVVLRPNTVVDDQGLFDEVDYFVPSKSAYFVWSILPEKIAYSTYPINSSSYGQETKINYNSLSTTRQNLGLNYTLSDIESIRYMDVNGATINTLKFKGSKNNVVHARYNSEVSTRFTSYKLLDAVIKMGDGNTNIVHNTEKRLDELVKEYVPMAKRLNATISAGSSNATINVNNKGGYSFTINTHKPVDKIVRDYPAIASSLNGTISAYSSNQFIMVGYGKHQMLLNNPNYASHLIGSGEENVYTINLPKEPQLQRNLEVNIYNTNNKNYVNSIDLRNLDLAKDRSQLSFIPRYDHDLGIQLQVRENSSLMVTLKDGQSWYNKVHVYLNDTVIPKRIELKNNSWALESIPNLEKIKFVPTGIFRYYELQEGRLLLYHNQPKDKHQIGIVNLKNKCISECDMKMVNNDLIISSGNNALVQVRNWSSNPKTREMIFVLNGTIVSKSECIVSMCSEQDIIEEFNVVKKQEEKLFNAVQKNDLNSVKDLINKGANINARNGNTLLHMAVSINTGNPLSLIKLLIEKGADISSKNNSVQTLLDVANQYGKSEVANFLRDKQSEYDHLLLDAARSGNLDKITDLLNSGANIEAKEKDGKTPLYLAAREGHLYAVKSLLNKGANIEAIENDKWTPLHTAAYHGKLDVVKLLVERNANIEAKTDNGKTPLELARENDKQEVVDFLRAKQDEKGRPVQRKRRDHDRHHSSRKPLAIGLSNQAARQDVSKSLLQNDKIDYNKVGATSGASRPSSPIDAFAHIIGTIGGTIVDNIKGAFQFIYSPFKPAIDMKHSQPSKAMTTQSIDTNGTLLLLDVFIRKITGQKYASTAEQPISELEARGCALNITERFEQVLENAAKKSGHRLDFNPLEVYKAIEGYIMSGEISKIPSTLYSSAKEACPEFKQTDKFLVRLANHLEEVLAEKEAVFLLNRQQSNVPPSKIVEKAPAAKISNGPSTLLNDTSTSKGISNVLGA